MDDNSEDTPLIRSDSDSSLSDSTDICTVEDMVIDWLYISLFSIPIVPIPTLSDIPVYWDGNGDSIFNEEFNLQTKANS